MTIANTWDESFPADSRAASNADDDMRRRALDIREQLNDGNHDNIATNPSTGARHVANDTDTEFPIYAADGTTKVAGHGSNIRNFGDGTRLDHIFEIRYAVDTVTAGSMQTIATIALEDDSVYSLEARIVSQAVSTAAHGALTTSTCYYRASAGVATEVAEGTVQDDTAAGGLTAQWTPSTNDVLLQVQHTGAGATHDVVAIVRYFRVD